MEELSVPTCVTLESWDDFVEVRRAKGSRAPWTAGAAKRVIKKLIDADRQGYDAQHMLDTAIERGWTSVFINPDTPKVSRAAAETKRLLDSQTQTPEQRAASDAARRRVMAMVRRVA